MCPRVRPILSFCDNIAMLLAIFLPEVVVKMAHLTVKVFVLSGSHAIRLMLHNLS